MLSFRCLPRCAASCSIMVPKLLHHIITYIQRKKIPPLFLKLEATFDTQMYFFGTGHYSIGTWMHLIALVKTDSTEIFYSLINYDYILFT